VYCFAVVGSTVGANKNHLGVFNAAGSGVVMRVWRVEAVAHLTATVTGLATSHLLKRTTTVGTGTAAVLRKFDPDAPNLPAQITGRHSYTGQPAVTADSELAAATLNNEETAAQAVRVPLFEAIPDRGIEPVTVREGGGLVSQQAGLAGAGAVSVFFYFTLEPA
jgi:hypothetical protein